MTEPLLVVLLILVLGVSFWRFRYQIRGVLDRMAHAYLIRSSHGYRSMYIAHQVRAQSAGVRQRAAMSPDVSDVEKTLPAVWSSPLSRTNISRHAKYQAEVVEDQATLEP